LISENLNAWYVTPMRLRFPALFSIPLVLGLFAFVAGCECDVDCACIAPGIDIFVVDATTKMPVEATIMANPATCLASGIGAFKCDGPPGTKNTFTISASGYTSKTITVNVPEIDRDACCDCGTYVWENVELVAMP
jgi:hypothetical protein